MEKISDELAGVRSNRTGLPPTFAPAAHVQQITDGIFVGAYLPLVEAGRPDHADALCKRCNTSPRHRLPCRFGYVDAAKRGRT